MLCLALVALQSTLGCSGSDPPATVGVGGTTTTGPVTSGGTTVGNAGATVGGAAAGGGAGPISAGSGGLGGAGGAVQVVSGGGTGEAKAGSAGGGAAGTSAGSGNGGGGTGGAPGNDGGQGGSGGVMSSIAIASQLDRFRLECPCIDANHFGADKQDNCDNAASVDRQVHPKQLGGDASTIYDVKLRVRGNTEPNTYVNGKLEQGRFYIGGQTSTPGYTAYMLTVADPPQTYFFNYNATTGHIHFLIDYEVVIPMRGGTTVTFEVNGGKSVPDGHGVSNREALVVPDVPPAPNPFNGQLVQFDVVSVQPRQ